MPSYDKPPRVTDILKNLSREQRRMSANRRVENAQITQGGITIVNPVGDVVGKIGELDDGTTGIAGFTADGALVNIVDTSEQAAQALADAATALTSANGKSKSTFSTDEPGDTANTAGDLWFQRDANGVILSQWEGMGGTSWTQRQLRSEVIASLDAGKITTGTLDADRIGANTITADKINGDSFTGNTFTGGKFIGADFWTSSSNPKMEISASANEIRGWGSDSHLRMALGPRKLVMNDDVGDMRIRLTFDGLQLWSAAPPGAPGTSQSSARLRPNDLIIWGNGGADWLEITVGNTYPQQRIRSNKTIGFSAEGVNNQIVLQSGGVIFSNYLYANLFRTTTQAANLHRSPYDAQIYLVSSMGYNKLDQEVIDLEAAEAVLDLEPKTWRDRSEVADNPDTTNRVPGFVAEEVAAISEERGGVLDPLVSHNESNGTAVIGINYDRIPAYLIPLIRDLRDRVETLEAQLASRTTAN